MPSRTTLAAAIVITAAVKAGAQECAKTFDSTYDLIQDVIFEKYGGTRDVSWRGSRLASDGRCDACTAGSGVTTDAEMFVLTESSYDP